MYKKNSIIKKIIVLFMVFAFIVSSDITFATGISDNDGSSFITKAEFDALKSNFQSQIDTYNSGIDSKIDEAIAAYLGGININPEPVDLFENFKTSLGTDRLIFAPGLNTGSSSYTNALDWSFVRHYTYYGINNIHTRWKSAVGSNQEYLQFAIYYNDAYSGAMPNNLYYGQVYRDGAGDVFSSDITDPLHAGTGTGGRVNQYFNESLSTAKVEATGGGEGWWFKKYNNTYWTLQYYCDEMFPRVSVEANYHTYLNKNDPENYTGDNKLGDSTAPTKTHSAYLDWGSDEDGTIEPDDSTTAKSTYSKITQILYKSYDTTQDYSNFQLATWTTGYGIYGLHNDSEIKSNGTQTLSLTDQNFYSVYYSNQGAKLQTNKLGGGKLTYTKIKLDPIWLDPSKKILNSALTGVAGEEVFLGGGAPIISANTDNQKIKIKIYVGTSNPSYKNINYTISDKQFVCGNVDTANGAKTLASGNITWTSDSTGKEIEFTTGEKGKIWINLRNNDPNTAAYLWKIEISDYT